MLEGALKEKPYMGAHGGDIPEDYLVLNIKGYKNKFYLENCAYKSADVPKILSLVEDDSVSLWIIDSLNIEQNVDVYKMSSIRLGLILNDEDFIQCSKSRWKLIFRITIIIAIILTIRIIGKGWFKL